ncbi:DNA-formamidopyrimidine glycosylase family protein [Pseudactinotalea sp.]|uniref:DNA-formamidopyrimidine glycosylase family protein n=1 Tax=Pseudactinotalea sp. TaxID=1926260 RepID=UPI003B3BAF61
MLRTARRLTQALAHGPLVRADLRWPSVAGADLLERSALETVSHGKHLLTRLDDGRTLHTHLRMEGTWQVRRTQQPPQPWRQHTVRVVLATARWTCAGISLGMVDLVPTSREHTLIGHLGPDLMADDVDVATAAANLRAQGDRPVGEALLDQRVAAGIGTIYTSETLWLLRLNPWQPAREIADPEEVIATAARIMRRSADAPSITATGDPRPGRDANAYGREHQPCRRCGSAIRQGRLGTPPTDRVTYWCATCQER